MTQAETFVSAFGRDVDEHPDELVYGRAKEVPGTHEVVEEHRWFNLKEVVYRFPDDSFVEFTYESPSTEMQEGQEWNTNARVVVPREVVRTVYVTP